jgi:chaperonin GroEL
MQDLAIVTGGQLISEEVGLKLEDVTAEMLGSAKKVQVTKDDTLVLGGGGSQSDIQERVQLIRDQIGQTTSEWDKEKLQERLAKLSGGVAVIKVGGASEVEVGEKKDRIDDALNATRAAVQEGIVPGGGVALLYGTQALDDVKVENPDQAHGVAIVKQALRAPAVAIAKNAGYQGDVIVGKLLEMAAGKGVSYTQGFNAATGQFVDMLKAGIIDPTKVVRTALVDAASVASLMTTTEAAITDLPKKEEGGHAQFNHGGPGGMF